MLGEPVDDDLGGMSAAVRSIMFDVPTLLLHDRLREGNNDFEEGERALRELELAMQLPSRVVRGIIPSRSL